MNTMRYQIPYMTGEYFDNGGYDGRVYRIMSPQYTLFLDKQMAQIRRLAFTEEAEFDFGTDFEWQYFVSHRGKELQADHIDFGPKTRGIRVVEEGHSCIRIDMPMLRYADDERFHGTVETVSYPDYFAVNYEVRSAEEIHNLTLRLTVSLKNHTVTRVGRNRFVVTNDRDENLIFAAFDPNVSLRALDEHTLEMTRRHVNIPAKHYDGAGFVVIPTKRATFADTKKVFALNDGVSVRGHMTYPEDMDTEVRPDIYGNCRLNITPNHWNSDVISPEVRNRYQSVDFTVTNDSDRDVLVPICFAFGRENVYSIPMPITGVSPMLRQNGVPTGLQVQLSKTWDGCGNDEHVYDDPGLLKQGWWIRATALVPVKKRSSVSYEYCCAFENYGGIAAVQVAQLGLMGWGNCYRQWHQLALGSHGETICYSVQGGGVMQDIRGLYVKGLHGGMNAFAWSANVGGGDFLLYTEPGEKDKPVFPMGTKNDVSNTITEYRAQCPVMSDIIYHGTTRDGKIATTYHLMTGGTDDAARHYHVLRYEFKEDTPFGRLSFYSHPSDGLYMPPVQRKIAVGTDDSAPTIRSFRDEVGYYEKPSFKNHHFPAGRFPWAMAYDADFLRCTPENKGKKSDVFHDQSNLNTIAIVREVKGRINGHRLTKLDYNIVDNVVWGIHGFGYELILPKRFGKTVTAGSYLDLTVELVTLPADPDAYYGESPVILNNLDKLNTPAVAPVFVLGNALDFDVTVGRLTRTYPPLIACGKGEVLAQFTMRGGLGYTPITFAGITAEPAKLQLQVKENGKFIPVTKEHPTGEEHDDIQVMKTAHGYDVVYAVKNARYTAGNNEYRLIVKE